MRPGHLALHLGRVDELLADRKQLYAALADAVQVIRDEVIDIL